MRIIFAFVLLFTIAGCNKKTETVLFDDLPERYQFNIPQLISFVGQDYDVVRKQLDKYAMLDKSSMGERNFNISLADVNDIRLSCKISEYNKKVKLINVTYSGVGGGDPYENELWYFYMQKLHSMFGEATIRFYEKNNDGGYLPSSNAALIDAVKTRGYNNASYMALWYLENKTKEISVFHSVYGNFQFRIELK